MLELTVTIVSVCLILVGYGFYLGYATCKYKDLYTTVFKENADLKKQVKFWRVMAKWREKQANKDEVKI